MGMRNALRRLGHVAAIAGVGACLAVTVQACGSGGSPGAEQISFDVAQGGTQKERPLMDTNVPAGFETATFAFG